MRGTIEPSTPASETGQNKEQNMSRSTYQIRVGREVRMTFSADLVEASAPIFLEGDATPFQTADARHRASEAAALVYGSGRPLPLDQPDPRANL